MFQKNCLQQLHYYHKSSESPTFHLISRTFTPLFGKQMEQHYTTHEFVRGIKKPSNSIYFNGFSCPEKKFCVVGNKYDFEWTLMGHIKNLFGRTYKPCLTIHRVPYFEVQFGSKVDSSFLSLLIKAEIRFLFSIIGSAFKYPGSIQ